MKLTVKKIKALSRPGLYGDGGTLYLNVAEKGSKSWIQRVMIHGRRRDIGLGGWPVVSLAEAREQAFENRRAIRAGGDPLQKKRKAKVPTFREAALHTLEATRPRFRTEKTATMWRQLMENYAFPKIGDMPVDRIGGPDVLRVLTPIWTSKADTARKLRQRIKATLAWAQAHGFVEHNAAGDGIDGALPAMRAVKENLRALPYAEVADALAAVAATPKAALPVKLAFRFLVLTAARTGEIRGATWTEIDMDAREWRIPASRMKANAEHRVPLSDAAMAVLDEARALRDATGLVFPSTSAKGLSNMAFPRLMKSIGLEERTTVHGFRSCFRTWAEECTSAPHAVKELSLAHKVGNAVEQAYSRSDLLAKRRGLMEQWAAFVTRESADVVRLRA